jgi:hypothetical protein
MHWYPFSHQHLAEVIYDMFFITNRLLMSKKYPKLAPYRCTFSRVSARISLTAAVRLLPNRLEKTSSNPGGPSPG